MDPASHFPTTPNTDQFAFRSAHVDLQLPISLTITNSRCSPDLAPSSRGGLIDRFSVWHLSRDYERLLRKNLPMPFRCYPIAKPSARRWKSGAHSKCRTRVSRTRASWSTIPTRLSTQWLKSCENGVPACALGVDTVNRTENYTQQLTAVAGTIRRTTAHFVRKSRMCTGVSDFLGTIPP